MKKKHFWWLMCCIITASLLFAGCTGNNGNETATSPDTPAEQDKANQGGEQNKQPAEPPKKVAERKYDKAPGMMIDTNKQYQAVVSTTAGDFTITLFAKDAPKTVNNFVFLSKEKFYDNLTFHRLIKDFMIQTGDPLGNGTGGPGYTFEDELENGHKYEIGVVAMANNGPDTNGSQFFIGTGPEVTGLNNIPNYTIFGKVTKGMDVVQKIAKGQTKPNPKAGGENSLPVDPVTIKSITIEES
ncbi:peptidylprolyl isomerase [Brevibacillus humidisoli]|uniref:peptidylprolyl isomerase n=1 Tax=Brevibacillus humidisoli TaxID=2895522 RepID=UPI001E618E0D|nr:peptidylprolyl isomerase [Brevibacillus humidisoli]UFJ42282.1 peptidylprolyl isomerase [Brevibacillus humidisoli]